jgi:hypothetical protein
VLRLLWAEDGLAVFTRSFGPAAAHEVVSSMVFSIYDAAAPFRSLALQSRIRYLALHQALYAAPASLTHRGTSSNRLVNGALQSLSLAVDECARALLAALLTRPLQTVVRRLDIQGCGLAVRLTHASSPKPVRPAHSHAPYSSGMRLTEAHWTVSRGFGTKRAYLASTR